MQDSCRMSDDSTLLAVCANATYVYLYHTSGYIATTALNIVIS